MITDLIQNLFAEAEKRTGKRGNKRASCEDISNWMFNHLRDKEGQRVNISVRTLERIYDQYVLQKGNAIHRGDPGAERLNYFALYLGYDGYSDFIRKNGGEEEDTSQEEERSGSQIVNAVIADSVNTRTVHASEYIEQQNNTTYQKIFNSFDTKRSKWLLLLAVFTAVVVTVILLLVGGKEDTLCLVWMGNHYESKACNEITAEEISVSVDREVWEDDLKDFRRIEIDRNTPLLGADRKPLVWYYYANDSFEFYNSDGKHPITGVPLKPITFDVAEAYLNGKKDKTPDDTIRDQEALPTQPAINESSKESVIPEAESVVTRGKYCFHNKRSEDLVVHLYPLLNGESLSQPLEVRSGEQVCPRLVVGKYTYQAKLKGSSTVLKSGNITIAEFIEGYTTFAAPTTATTPTDPVETEKMEKDCTTGKIEIVNKTGKDVAAQLSDFGENGAPMATFFKTIHIAAGDNGMFYGIKQGNYTVKITHDNDFAGKDYSIHVENCETTLQTVK